MHGVTMGQGLRIERGWASSLVKRMGLALSLIIGLIVGVSPLPLGATAATTYYVATTGNDANNCQAATTPCQTIGAAVAKSASGDAISIAAGVYHEHLSLTHNLTLTGAGAGQTVVDGSGAGAGTLVAVASTVAATLAGLTIQHGSTDDPSVAGGITTGGALTLVDSVVSGNTGGDAGGIYQYGGSLSLVDSEVSDNSGDTGGVDGTFGVLTVISSTINGNDGAAGGIRVYNAILTLTASTVRANNGGGIENEGAATLTNSTISGNIGPGLDNFVTASLFNSTVTGNSGSGIFSEGPSPVSLANTIVAVNTGPDCTGALASLGYNLLGSAASCSGLTEGVDGDRVGVDPRLAPPADNGGPTPTQALLPGSPAIDGGNPGGCKDSAGAPLAADQRGLPRPDGVNNRCDIGAYEAQAPPPGTATPLATPVGATSVTATPARTGTPGAAGTPVPAPSPVLLRRRPPAPLRASAPPLSYYLSGHAVAEGKPIFIRLHTDAHARVRITLQATTETTVVTGAGKNHRRVTRQIVLYHTALKGGTDEHGVYTGHLRIAYGPSKPLRALLVIETQSSRGVATRSTHITIDPPRPSRAKGQGRR